MGLDPLSPVAPARVRCLLLPCGRITKSRFLEFAKRLQEEAVIRLGDVSPSTQPERSTFSPLAFPQGVILFDLVVSESTPGQKALYPFEVSREPLIVLGLADALEYGISKGRDADQQAIEDPVERQERTQEVVSELAAAAEGLKAVYSATLCHKVFLFDYEGALPGSERAVLPVPPVSRSTHASMRTIMCDLASEFLAEMTEYARSVQALATVETPKQALPDGYAYPQPEPEHDSKRQSWFTGNKSNSPSLALQRLGQRASMPAHLFQSAAAGGALTSPPEEHPRSEATSPTVDNAATTFDQMHISSLDRRLTQMDPSLHDRASAPSSGSDPLSEKLRHQGRGRVGVVIGQMYLSAGRWPDAVRELVQGGIIARSTNDHIWHAKAVESIIVALVMCLWAEVDFDIPPLCLPIAERSSVLLGKSSKKNETISVNETFVSQAASKEAQAGNLKTLSHALPEIIHHIIRLYTRSTAEHIAQLALSEIFIRLAKLSAYLLLFPGLQSHDVLDSLVLNRPLKQMPDTIRFPSLVSPAKAEIAAIASASIPVARIQEMLSHVDRIAIHAGAATVLGMLGYHRKKAFILKELLGFLQPALERGPERASVGLALYSSPLLKSPEVTNGIGSIANGPPRDQDLGVDTVYEFLALVCRVYGSLTVNSTDEDDSSGISRFRHDNGDSAQKDEGAMLAAQIETEALTRSFGSKRLKMNVLYMCMNVCETVPDFRGAVAFASSLLRTASSGIAPGLQDTDGGPSLNVEDQVRITSTITKAAATGSEAGMEKLEAEYWDDFVVRDVEILPISPDLNLTPRKKSELNAVKASIATQGQGPFIVNQFTPRNSAAKTELVLAAGEKFTFAILLQNLFNVNLEIDSLEMDADGAKLDAKTESIVIGPYKTQRLRLIAHALEPGQLTIRGCRIKVRNCSTRRYPIFRESWRAKEPSKLKRHGLALIQGSKDRPASTASEQLRQPPSNKPSFATLSARVVEPQPRMALKSTSVPQDNVMVLEGEKKMVKITLRNVSSRPIDFVSLAFDDSTLPILRAAVQDRELPAAELYEVEYGIYRRAALSWPEPDTNVHVEAGEEWSVDVEVLGKPGLTSGTVLIDYAQTGNAGQEETTFFTRKLSLQFDISVNPSIDLVRNDIFALAGPLAEHHHLTTDPKMDPKSPDHVFSSTEWTQRLMRPIRERLSMPSQEKEYCLLLLDFYNSYSTTLVVTPMVRRLDQNSGNQELWTQVFTTSDVIDPGQTERYLIPVPRIALTDPYAPIPSLNPSSKRQFVVSTGKISEGYERSSRDAFWHREEILKYVRVQWLRCDPREGEGIGWVELRAIRLTMRMLDALKLESVSVRIGLSEGEAVKQLGPSHFQVKTDEFVTIQTKVSNRSQRPVQLVLRLQPGLRNQSYNIALDLARKFAFTGVLQQPLPIIEPGESFEAELGSVFLCAGEFEIGASVEEISLPASSSKKPEKKSRDRGQSVADLDVLPTERTDRRIWFAKEACKVDAEEE